VLKSLVADPLLFAARQRVRRLWRPMLAWSAFVWALTAIGLLPLSSAVVSWRLGRSDTLVVGNEDLLSWLASPGGVAYLLFAGGLALLNWILRFAGLFVIVTDDLERRRVSFRGTLLRLLREIPTLWRFSIKAVAWCALLSLPLLAGLGLIHAIFLRSHDINYFLSVRPPQWYYAVALAASWLALMGSATLYLLGRSILALPGWLEGYRGFHRAIRRSWQLTRHRAARLLRILVVATATWLGFRLLVDLTLVTTAAASLGLLDAHLQSVWPLVAVSGAFLAVSVGADLAIDFLGFALVSTVVTKFYYEDTDLHQEALTTGRHETIPAGLTDRAAAWLQPWRLILLLVLFGLGSALVGHRLLERLPPPHPVVITAHRAGPPPAPENTLAALELAIAARADFAEIDVMRTRDGVIVVTHDLDLMRLARDPRRIAQHDYESLRGVVKLADDGSPPSERRLATLREFLERSRGRIRLNIELKYYGWDPGLAAAVVQEVQEAGMTREVVLMSLHLEAVRQLQQLVAGEIPIGYVSSVAIGPVSRLPVDFLAVHQGRVSSPLLRETRRRGQEVHVWTVNRSGPMVDLLELGIDGVITDDPALAVRVREEWSRLLPAQRLLLRFRRLFLPPHQAPDPAAAG
jgi:glycerophosphoryl diester phosphodiesterase